MSLVALSVRLGRAGYQVVGYWSLARASALVAMCCHPRDFKSDRHFRHQLVIRFLRMVRAPRVEMWGGGSAIYRYDRIMVAVRELFGQRLEARLGLLCLRMARILQDHTRALHQPPRQITNP